MKLNINEVYHNYIVRVVIFSLFLYKGQLRQPNVYRLSVNSYLKKRLSWDIKLIIDTGIKLDKEDERDIILDEILNNIESDYLSKVVVTFTTPIKETTIEVDLSDDNKYESFIYS